MKHYLKTLENTVHNHWNLKALCDYGGESFTYGNLATHVEQMRLFFEATGIKKGDKIAICARNSARWAMTFWGINANERVAVPLLADFHPDSVSKLTNHSDSVLLFTNDDIWAKMNPEDMPNLRAAINVKKAHPDWNIVPEIMIPLVSEIKELKYVKDEVVKTADAEIAAAGIEMTYEVGTMIEIPRACVTADEIAKEAEFFCFGTNDLTQMTYGFSRDDAGKFLNAYYDAKILESDPFAKLDQVGVGSLMKMAIEKGKAVRPSLHIGICGEHGGDPTSVEFCHRLGLTYVSCSPFRVPIARLAAAQAAIKEL